MVDKCSVMGHNFKQPWEGGNFTTFDKFFPQVIRTIIFKFKMKHNIGGQLYYNPFAPEPPVTASMNLGHFYRF